MLEDKVQNRQFLNQMADGLFDYYSSIGNHKKANDFALFLIEDLTKMSDDRVKGSLFELERKFATQQKEKTILIQEQKLEKNYITILLLCLGALVLLFIIFIIIYRNKSNNIIKEKKLTQLFTSNLLSKTEEERKRIASDLHDSVSNELVSLRLAIENKDELLKIKIDAILEEVRSISRNLSPTLFDKIGLEKSIDQLVDKLQHQHDFLLTTSMQYNNTLSTKKELQLYRIIQEAITNILKHANAIAGKLSIVENNNEIHVSIIDNGKGFDVASTLNNGNSFGLLNISERTKYLNGTVQFKSNTKGTQIDIVIPI